MNEYRCFDEGLLRCPCCGGTATLVVRMNKWRKQFACVACTICQLQTGTHTLQQQGNYATADEVPWTTDIAFARAADSWNRRTGAAG